jgi:NAD(P)-dependent dehydrogenase (short-subunit alcohol dehydrogenase family)
MAAPVVIIGGTSGIGLELARQYVELGQEVVISGRDGGRAGHIAAELGAAARGVGVDLSVTKEIAGALSSIDEVRHLVIAAIERDKNHIITYDRERAERLVTLKLVGYPEVVHVLRTRLVADASVVLFGGLAKERPYPGSTTVSTVNGGISGLVRTLAYELAPVRVNAVHPGIVGDSPEWQGKQLDAVVERTPIGRLVKMGEVAQATRFLLDCPAMNGVDLFVDGGWMLR